MKRGDLLRHLKDHNCVWLREGGNHSVWVNRGTGAQAAVPRHNEIDNRKAADICKQLGVPRMR